ncbi:putative fatty acyl-CoA reductase CG5065 [Cotesia typhae]|uniref:putative fatty acyl-CoA reductase CG5065 n=1 Tax=Cotesia typhae TaxID=2053667 RepID=UPI003D686305
MGTSNTQTENDHKHNNEEANPGGTSIEAFFAASVILITGATGFLGKALLEKLLRSCPRISTIYVLIRPKKDLTMEERFQELLDSTVFDRIRRECPSAFSKIIPVMGDVSQPDLGLSEQDRLMLTQKVNIVFHSAATVRFNEPLKVAMTLNTRGTERVIELCTGMINLISFIHVSTAYSNPEQAEVDEIIYSTKIMPEIAIDMCENLDDETLTILEEKLKGRHPNTYTLTKRLAELIILKRGTSLPVAIVRPSIVCAAYREPYPGWIDNTSGLTGLIVQISRGTLKSVYCKKNLKVDIIPVDFVVDTLVCAAWHNVMRHTNTIKIYNCVSGARNPITWGKFGHYLNKYAVESPTKLAVWYPGFNYTPSLLFHKISTVLFHHVPAFIIDIVLKFRGEKPMMLKLSKRFARIASTGYYFANNEWNFSSDNVNQLSECVKTVTDSSNFNVDIKTLDWSTYVHGYILGIRKYILKDELETLTQARNRLSKLYWFQRSMQALMALLLIKLILR